MVAFSHHSFILLQLVEMPEVMHHGHNSFAFG